MISKAAVWVLANLQLFRVSHHSRLSDENGLCTDLLWKTSARRPSESRVTSHRLKWGLLPPNEVGRIAELFRQGEGRKICSISVSYCPWTHGLGEKKKTLHATVQVFVATST